MSYPTFESLENRRLYSASVAALRNTLTASDTGELTYAQCNLGPRYNLPILL
jgi:hypothetical protein